MKKNKYLHRLIALVMTAVMLLSLVAIDNRFGIAAKDEFSKEVIDLEDYIPKKVKYKEAKDGSVKIDSVKEIEITVPLESAVTFKGDYLMEALDADDANEDQKVATSCDADEKDAPKKASKIKKVKVETVDDEYRFAVYKTTKEEGIYDFAGIVAVYSDEGNDPVPAVPVPTIQASVTESDELIAKTGYYYAKPGSSVNIKLAIADGTDDTYIRQESEDPADITKVAYTVDGGAETIIDADDDGNYALTVNEAGTYEFTVTNRGGESGVSAVKILYPTTVQITDVTASENTTVKKVGDKIQELLNKVDASIKVTVSAKETVDGSLMPLTLKYRLANGAVWGEWQKADMTEDVDAGCYKASVSIPKSSATGEDYKVAISVCDSDYTEVSTYTFDENGAIVFIDDDEPDFVSGVVNTYQGTSVSASTSLGSYSYNSDRWYSRLAVKNVKTEENHSPIDFVVATFDGTPFDRNIEVSANGNKYTYTYTDWDSDTVDLEDGVHTISYAVTNRMELDSIKNVTFNLDATKPVVTVTSAVKNAAVAQDEEYVVSGATGETLTVTATDPGSDVGTGSGVASTKVIVNGSEKALAADNTLTLADAGVYDVVVTVTDKAGNEAAQKFTVIVNNETLTDEITAAANGTPLTISDLVYTGGNNVTVTYKVTGLDLDQNDVISNVVRRDSDVTGTTGEQITPTIAKNSSGINTTLTLIYTLQKEGVYSFNIKTKHHYIDLENDANTTEKSCTIVYDKSAPSVTTMEFVDYEAGIDNVYYYSKTTVPKIKIAAKDSIAIRSYKITDQNGQEIVSENLSTDPKKELEQTFELTAGIQENQPYTITFYIDDMAGNGISKNVSDEGIQYQFEIDSISPDRVAIADMADDGSLNLKSYWNGSAVTVSASAEDNHFITSFNAEAICDGKAVAEQEQQVTASKNASAAFTYSEAGTYEVTVYAYDEVGNVNTATCHFVIDGKPADISFTGIPDNGIYRNDSKHPITINVKDDYGISADKVKITEYYETYDGTKGQLTVLSENTDIKTTKATVNSCEVIDGKPMKYYFNVETTDNSGNVSSTTSKTFYYDDMNPEISVTPDIVSEEKDYYYNDKVTFKANVKEQFALGTVVYLLNTEDYDLATKASDYKKKAIKTYTLDDLCEKTFEFSASKAGFYDWTVVAVDGAGNEDAVTEMQFTIDKERPEAEIDGVPEDGLSTGTEVAITITDNEALDKDDFTVIQHYKYYNGTKYKKKTVKVKQTSANELTATANCDEMDGKACSYYFTVVGKDKAGNEVIYDQNASKFKVDGTAPEITITPYPDENDGYYNKGVRFKINVKEQFEKKHKITVSDKNKSVNGDADDVFVLNGTDGTFEVKRNAEGIYNLKIKAEDAFGNLAEDKVSFIVDKSAPTIGIATVSKLNNGNVALNVNIADNYKGKEYIVHVIRKDASGAVVYNKDYRKEIWKTTTANPDLVFTDEGDYEISVSAEDKAGNKKIAENVTFRIDKTAPVLSITGVADSQTTDCTATLSVNEAFPFSYDGSSLGSTDVTATITKKTDGAGTTNIATLNTGNFSSGNPHTATYSFTEDGEYTITFNAKDMVGNTAAAVTKTFKVDKNAPELFVTAVNSKKSNISEYQIVGGASDDSKDYVDMNLEVKETFFATNKVSITVHKDGKDVSSGYFKNFSSSSEVSRGSQRFEDDGVYTVEISAQDAIGNKAKDYSMAFTVDNTPPSVENTEKMEGFAARRNENGDLLLNSKDFSDIKDKGYDAFWTVNDTSVFTASVKLDGIDFVDFSDLTDGYHTMMIEVTDEVGHKTTNTFDFTYDGTAPRIIISGVDDKSVVRNPFTMSIGLEDPDDTITEIVINGKTIDPTLYKDTNSYDFQVSDYGKYEVKVTAADAAGNVSSTFDAETGEVFSFQLRQKLSPVVIILIILAVLILAGIIIWIILRKRKKAQQ